MWPGQQPPGGEQNPQDQNQNPYQQPGYQQPNPYQQPTQPAFPQQSGYPPPPGQPGQPGQPPQGGYPTQPGYPQQGQGQGYPQQGYAQPNPYQQPTVPQYQVPGSLPPQGPGGGGDNNKKTKLIAIVAAAAVVVAAGVTGFLLLNKNDDKEPVAGKPSTGTSSTPPAGGTGSASAAPEPSGAPSTGLDNPRDGEDFKPTIPGWKVVHNPKYGTLFDVPPEWDVLKPGMSVGVEDEKRNDGMPLVTMSGPTQYKSEWCTFDSDKNGRPETWGLASAGTKGGQGAKDTASAARGEAGTWVWGAYAQHMPEKSIKISQAQPYTTKSGLKGSMATATAPNVTKRNKCETDGKSLAFTFITAKGDYSTFVLYTAAGVKDEIPDATIQKILSTVRLSNSS
ncbi:hypothetical protein ACIQRS_20030 [Streptomyces termitum]|uniref:DUF8017 domain-containing protein n=1 Tax=Streptomyces termitum TaxID=67368 RepID=A0A918T1K0_9ACTN|nr:hypothetical protein [Streptomyces termitum]GHA84774.1 hypothetical protein GCM10010305_30650 [Streptomyces termitum]